MISLPGNPYAQDGHLTPDPVANAIMALAHEVRTAIIQREVELSLNTGVHPRAMQFEEMLDARLGRTSSDKEDM